MNVIVAISTVADGSMYNRHDLSDPVIVNNRDTFLRSQGIDINQSTCMLPTFNTKDFCKYEEISEVAKGQGMKDDTAIRVDAIITTHKNHAVFLPIADCIGAIFYDPINQVLALAHLGRHSLEQNGGQKIVEHLRDNYGSVAATLKVWLTPSAGKDVYKIWALDNKGMKESAYEQFFAAGLLRENITDNNAETTSDKNYYSYSELLKGHRSEDGDHAIVAMMTD